MIHLFVRQCKFLYQSKIFGIVPVLKGMLHYLSDLINGQTFRDTHLIQHNADILFCKFNIVPVVLSENGNTTTVLVNHIKNELYGGAFTGTIHANKPHNTATWQCQI